MLLSYPDVAIPNDCKLLPELPSYSGTLRRQAFAVIDNIVSRIAYPHRAVALQMVVAGPEKYIHQKHMYHAFFFCFIRYIDF